MTSHSHSLGSAAAWAGRGFPFQARAHIGRPAPGPGTGEIWLFGDDCRTVFGCFSEFVKTIPFDLCPQNRILTFLYYEKCQMCAEAEELREFDVRSFSLSGRLSGSGPVHTLTFPTFAPISDVIQFHLSV